jgi:hypothetical protein
MGGRAVVGSASSRTAPRCVERTMTCPAVLRPLLQSYLKKYAVGQVISGPSTCCNSMTWSGQFMAAANGVIDIFSMHDYPLRE